MPPVRTDSADAWARIVSDQFVSLAVRDVATDFAGTLEPVDLGRGVRLTRVRTSPCRVVRTSRMAVQDASDDVLFLVHLGDPADVHHEERRSVMRPGYGSVHVADRPYELVFRSRGDELVLQLPRRLLPSKRLLSAERLRRGVAPEEPVLRVFRAFSAELLGIADSLTGSAREEMGQVAVDLLAAVLGAGGDHEQGRDGGAATLVRLKCFVRSRLEDPGLGPETLARAHGVSVRYVHRLFAADGTSPAAFIRAERLRRAQHLLGGPRGRALPVAAVAARLGFGSTEGFIRAFSREYGCTPGRWRADDAATAAG